MANETVGVNLLKKAENVETAKQLLGYTGVRIFVGTNDDGDDVVYEAGNEDGSVLEVKNPFGTQEMAQNILEDIQGYRYQPLKADTALLDPAAEMGDGITVNGIFSGIFVRATQFGRLMASNVEAPTEEEIDHEFAVESPSDRQYTRFVRQTKAMISITNDAITAEVSARESADEAINSTLAIHATDIQAKVSKQSPTGQTTFGWNLTDTSWTVFSGSTSNTILKATSSGLEVKGKVTATSGKIGGFDILSNYLSYNNMTWSSSQTTGIYLGTSGFRLGQKFKVDTSGNVTASGITATGIRLQGTLTFLNSDGTSAGTLSAANLRQGAIDGYNWGTGGGSYGGYSSKADYSLSGAGAGYSAKSTWDSATDSNRGISYLRVTNIYAPGMLSATSLQVAYPNFSYGGNIIKGKTIKDGDGNYVAVLTY